LRAPNSGFTGCLTAAEPVAATDRLQLRSFLTTLPAAAELVRSAVARSLNDSELKTTEFGGKAWARGMPEVSIMTTH
jgi:hypothetical protein